MFGKLEKMQITAYGDSGFTRQSGPSFQVLINPEKYTHRYGIQYNQTQAQGSNGPSPTFNRMANDQVSFELIFDGTGVIPSALPSLANLTGNTLPKQIESFKRLVFDYSGDIHSPKYLKLAWGTLLFKGRLQSLDLTFTLFQPDGAPLRARANLSLIGYSSESELARKANKTSPDLSHVRTVRAGDTLPLMCHRIYGQSGLYLQVAAHNRLTDFRNLVVGSQLEFPPLADVSK